VDFVQGKRVQEDEGDIGFQLFYGPRNAFPKREAFDRFVSGKSVNLSQDDVDVMNYLKKIGYDFAEALFSTDFSDMEAGGPTDENCFEGMEGPDDGEFFDSGGSKDVAEPDYAAIFKK
jgi:hypothetical protein